MHLMPHTRWAIALTCLAFAGGAWAQAEDLFLPKGAQLAVFREETLDRRFLKSRLGKMLASGGADPEILANPGCVQLLSALLATLAESAPLLHRRDDKFFVDPVLQDALNTQVSLPQFPAMGFLAAMIRRVRIDGCTAATGQCDGARLPDAWFETAKVVNQKARIIDLAKLKLINEGASLVENSYYSIPLLRERYLVEVRGANSAVVTDVAGAFRDAYLDRDVAWGGALLVDMGSNAPKKGKGRKKASAAEMSELVAVLEWQPPDPRKTQLDLMGQHPVKVPPIRIIAKLAPRQYIDLEKVAKGSRMLIRGRFWEMTQKADTLEVRDALLFADADLTRGPVILANPAEVAQCPAALNELTGLAPNQAGGFKH
jgi:hypothetical protein